MKYLNVGCRWNLRFLEEIRRLNRINPECRIDELYGSLPGLLPTARARDRLPQVSLEDAAPFIAKCQASGISICYTVNASCIGPIQNFNETQFRKDLRALSDLGITRYTVTSPLLARIITEEVPDAALKISTITRLWTISEMTRWLKYPVYAFTIEHNIVKDLALVSYLNNYCMRKGVQLEVLANEFCLQGCPHRNLCYNLSSHDSQRGPFDYYPFGWCYKERERNPVEWLKSPIILPQDLELYSRITGVTHFKITGRTAPDEVILRIAECYIRERWDGNLLALWPQIHQLAGTDTLEKSTYISCKHLPSLVKIWEKMSIPCQLRDCDECGICAKLYELAGGKPNESNEERKLG